MFNYENWIKQVDKMCMYHYGMPSEMLPDWDWDGEYNSDVSPLEAFNEFKLFMEEELF